MNALSAADLDAYLARIGHPTPQRPDLASLAALHTAHVGAIPFENLDIRWGRGIALDLPSLVAKLVHARRGGYCFEQNGLFAAVLTAFGYSVRPLAARVRFGAARVLPRTHQLLLVEIEGEPFVADVGFGAQTLLAPLPLARGTSTQAAWRYRLDEEDGLWVLQIDAGERWADLYAFTLAPEVPADAEMANWYVSTHPASRFVQTTTVQRATPQARHTLRDREYTIDRGHGDVEVRAIGDADLDGLLRATFGLDLAGAPALPLPPMR